MHIGLLENYPFKNIGVSVRKELSQQGTDFVLLKSGEHVSFEVFSMFEGSSKFGVSQEFGKYFVISKIVDGWQYDCLYGCLDNINENLQKYAIIQGDKDFMIPSGYFLGWANTNGNKKSARRLHIELSVKNILTGERMQVQLYSREGDQGKLDYPKVGESLAGSKHFWISDNPEFA